MIFFWPSKLLKTWQLYSHLALSFLLQKMPPGVPLEQFVNPVQQLQHHEEAHAGQLGQQQQQQQEEEESETLQPVRFDSFSALPIREVLVMFKTKSGLIKKMRPRPQAGTVWRFFNGGENKDNWKAQLYQWVEPGEKNSNSSGMLQCIFWNFNCNVHWVVMQFAWIV